MVHEFIPGNVYMTVAGSHGNIFNEVFVHSIPVLLVDVIEGEGIGEVVGYDFENDEWFDADENPNVTFLIYLDNLSIDRGEAHKYIRGVQGEMQDD